MILNIIAIIYVYVIRLVSLFRYHNTTFVYRFMSDKLTVRMSIGSSSLTLHTICLFIIAKLKDVT